MHRRRPRVAASFPTGMAAVVLALTVSGPAGAAVGPIHAAPAESVTLTGNAGNGPVALRQVTFGQSANDLVVRIGTAANWDPKTLRVGTRGRRICVSTYAGPATTGETRLCLGWRDGRLIARRARIDAAGKADRWRTVTARIGRPNGRTVQIRGPLASFGVTAGPVRWSVLTSWDGSAACNTAGACDDRLPRSGAASYEARQTVNVGCTASGPTVVNRGPRGVNPKRIALTFDDGPWALTPQFLNVLGRQGVPATFFVVGQYVGGRESVLQRMVREGHAIGNHTWGHANVSGGGQGQIASTNAAIHAATGVTPCLFRPPYGARSATLDGQLRSLGMLDVLWTVDTNDWQLPGTATIAKRVIGGAVPGAIVLMHDGGGPRGSGLAALPRIIAGLRARGYRFVTVPELLGLRQRVGYR